MISITDKKNTLKIIVVQNETEVEKEYKGNKKKFVVEIDSRSSKMQDSS